MLLCISLWPYGHQESKYGTVEKQIAKNLQQFSAVLQGSNYHIFLPCLVACLSITQPWSLGIHLITVTNILKMYVWILLLQHDIIRNFVNKYRIVGHIRTVLRYCAKLITSNYIILSLYIYMVLYYEISCILFWFEWNSVMHWLWLFIKCISFECAFVVVLMVSISVGT